MLVLIAYARSSYLMGNPLLDRTLMKAVDQIVWSVLKGVVGMPVEEIDKKGTHRHSTMKRVHMLDTMGNVHSLVNACRKLGYEVVLTQDPAELDNVEVKQILS